MAADYWIWLDIGTRELAFFAAFWFFLGGVDELLVDLVWFRSRGQRAIANITEVESVSGSPKQFAIFIAAWKEADVIGETLRNMVTKWQGDHVRIFLGCYANDPDTLKAAMKINADPRLQIVINPYHGPTSKAQCLNEMWQAMAQYEEDCGQRFDAVVLHDAEDMVHADALAAFSVEMDDHEVVQLPVIPLIHPQSPLVSGHYADEFAEAHGKAMVVRDYLKAGLPLAGVGCAINRDVLQQIADSPQREGLAGPFSEDSLTEDYELGLLLHMMGARATLCRRKAANGEWIATRAYFPHKRVDSVRQKSRWIAGIALNGWDRIGWHGGWAEFWMRLRDRRTVLNALVLSAAYLAILGSGLLMLASWLGVYNGLPFSPLLQTLLWLNLVFLLWRIMMRIAFTADLYGFPQGLLAMPRIVVANFITILAARRALGIYCNMLMGAPLHWDKTSHYVVKRDSISEPSLHSRVAR
ncbi:glycosyl transferase family protein [Alterisphingorhabdus coralli]|uniref:Glycosyl transferase family protein n=1 Tax=Alterisphingorhabdus coralli TaxID=3071408 RepID=A0AA97F954_9SPHN|nr:glycosyl transferase family protein [Parasphingorhabdus sp. SCSIO 66989]WOE75578.1 glycosyl transferase family protein [Parasphingorhabdus sp. SCSIO 66989]